MKKNDVLFILISAFVLVIALVIFNIYHNAKTSTIQEATSIQIQPITPTFDTKTIEALKQRIKILPVFVLQTNPTPTATTQGQLQPTPQTASQSAQKQATQSGLQL